MARKLMFMQIHTIIHINAAVLLIYFFLFNIRQFREDGAYSWDLHEST